MVYGETLDGYLPEDKARSVHGVDPETMLRFKVEKHSEESLSGVGEEGRLRNRRLRSRSRKRRKKGSSARYNYLATAFADTQLRFGLEFTLCRCSERDLSTQVHGK